MAYVGPQHQFEAIVPPDDGPSDAFDSATTTPLSTVHTAVARMPGPRSHEAPQFRGRKIKKFLYEFELQAKSAKLSDAQKCEYVVSYCKEKEAKFIRTLPGYESQQWNDLKDELLSYYPAEHEDRVYRIKDLRRFVQRDRKIRRRMDLDTYRRKFRVIMISLEAKSRLNEIEKDDFFFRGLKPRSFRHHVKRELKAQNRWTDLTRPPAMDSVVSIAKALLKHDLYYDDESDEDTEDESEEDKKSRSYGDSDSDASDNDALSDESDDEEDEKPARKHKSKKKTLVKRESKQSTKDIEPKTPELKSEQRKPDSDTVFKSNMDDLADRISKLTIELTKHQEKPKFNPQATTSGVWRCFMCDGDGHGFRECPETKAFLAAGVLQYNAANKLVMADGSKLPRVIGRATAHVIREQTAMRTSAANLEWMREYELANNEFANLGDAEFEVQPVERVDDKKGRQSKAKPYDRPSVSKTPPPTVKIIPPEEPKRVPVNPNRAYVEVPRPPVCILKRPDPTTAGPTPMDVDLRAPSYDKGKGNETPKTKEHSGSTKTKLNPSDIKVQDSTGKPVVNQKSSPAYKFASELQQRTKNEELFEKLLKHEVSVPLGAIIGSTFEINKRFQAATKIHRVPVTQATAAHEIERVAREDFEYGEVCEIHNLETNNLYDEDDPIEEWTIDDEAERCYQKLLESEYLREYGIADLDSIRRPPSYLAMVTAKIQGSILRRPCTMLIDTGSELNIMTSDHASVMELPMDPAGAAWTLRGVSGHQIALEGLCRDVPISIGGVEVNHNFFITRDKLNGKDVILGQPWLFGHSTRIDYVHDVGMIIQIWNEGDRDNGASVKVKLPIITAPRNVSHAYAYDSAELASVEVDLSKVKPGNDLASNDPPAFLTRISRAFELPDSNSKELRPDGLETMIVSREDRDTSVFRALKRTWHVSEMSNETTMPTRVQKVLMARGYDEKQAQDLSRQFTRSVMGAKYKSVAKKVLPVATHDPDASVPMYKTIDIGKLKTLPTNPSSFESLEYTGRLSKERMAKIISRVPKNFLTKAELDLLVHVLKEKEDVITFTDAERGTFNRKYYPDYVMKTIPHTPWQIKPLRLPLARTEEIMTMLKEQMHAGKYESSQSSYRARFFAVEKKDGSLRIVHDLQPLNAVSIRDSAALPRIDDMLDSFAGAAIYGIFDLKSGFDSCVLASESRDMTTFGANRMGSLRQTTLPQGYTNSPVEFQRRTTHMIEPMIPEKADVFIDDCALKGPKTSSQHEPIPENSQIRKFVWQYALNLQEMLARIFESGATVSGTKIVLATPCLAMLGAIVSIDGMHVSHEVTAKLKNWPPCRNPTEVRGFLGTVGVVRRWIKDFAKIAKPLTLLTKKMAPHEFKWTPEAEAAMTTLRDLAANAVPIRALDFRLAAQVKPKNQRESDLGLVTIQVDSSVIGVGWMISQHHEDQEYPIVFGSITFNPVESRYSQPKLELYGVLRAFKAERHRLYHIHFKLQVDASSLIQMINAPDLPNAAMTRWITYIKMFSFEIEHN